MIHTIDTGFRFSEEGLDISNWNGGNKMGEMLMQLRGDF